MKIFSSFNLSNSDMIVKNITHWTSLILHPPNPPNPNNSNYTTTSSIFKHTIDNVIPLYCSILGLVIICLIGYVIYKLWKQKNDSSLCTGIPSKGSSGNSLRIPKYSSSAKSDNKEMAALVTSNEDVKLPSFEQFLLSQPLYCLPEDQIEAIVFSLSDESSGVGWLQLALYYNFKQDEIEAIVQNNTKIEAVRKFLKKWSENPNHNLKKLIKSLHEISRPDTAFLIKSVIRKFSNKERNETFNKETNNNLLLGEKQSNGTKTIST